MITGPDYSEEERRNMREVAALEAMEHNQQVMSDISLEDILPQVHERIGSEKSPITWMGMTAQISLHQRML